MIARLLSPVGARSFSVLHRRLTARLRSSRSAAEFFRYAVVGASGYVLNLAIFSTAVDVGGVDHRAAAALAFSVAVINNFILNRSWTFARSRGNPSVQAFRFFTASLAAFFAALGILDLLVASGVQPIVAQAVSIAITTPVSFTVNKIWSFRDAFR